MNARIISTRSDNSQLSYHYMRAGHQQSSGCLAKTQRMESTIDVQAGQSLIDPRVVRSQTTQLFLFYLSFLVYNFYFQ